VTAAEVLVLAAAGATVGSFAATAGLRSAVGRPWLSGRSACDHCGRRLGVTETLPLVSFVVARGRCRTCGGVISPAHFLGETAGAVVLPAVVAVSSLETGAVVLLATMAPVFALARLSRKPAPS
jgi:leader peptidase (prepilin peptidase)/N-methyltransferase